MSLLSPQQKYGQETIRRIQKASRPSIADAGIGILKSIQEGLQQRVKNNYFQELWCSNRKSYECLVCSIGKLRSFSIYITPINIIHI